MSRLIPQHAPAWLLIGGLVLTWMVASLLAPAHEVTWQTGLAAGLCVGLPNAALVLFFRHQERLVREMVIAEVREMMADRVRNPLAVIGMCVSLSGDGTAADMVAEDLNVSMGKIMQAVDGLSTASLGSWQAHYREALANDPDRHLQVA